MVGLGLSRMVFSLTANVDNAVGGLKRAQRATDDLKLSSERLEQVHRRVRMQMVRLGAIMTAVGAGIVYGLKSIAQQGAEITGNEAWGVMLSDMNAMWSEMAVIISDAVIPVFVWLWQEVLAPLGKWFQNLPPGIQDFIVKFALIGGIALLIAGPLLSLITLLGGAAGLVGALGGVATAIGTLILAHPVLAAVALATIGVMIAGWEHFKKVPGDVSNFFTDAVNGNSDGMRDHWAEICADMVSGFAKAGRYVAQFSVGMANIIIAGIEGVMNAIAALTGGSGVSLPRIKVDYLSDADIQQVRDKLLVDFGYKGHFGGGKSGGSGAGADENGSFAYDNAGNLIRPEKGNTNNVVNIFVEGNMVTDKKIQELMNQYYAQLVSMGVAMP